ncbi:MAG: KpsF/GutQ family sugar-phosphate isomerase [Deltaproteobacteria bacterium]|nr:MAG: KpsF/GutQ family sugar-phosphate isomerase [Deltaproteobacteria bacterium]
MNLDFEQIANDVLALEAQSLLDAKGRFGFIDEFLRLLDKMQGRLIVTGVGKSGLVGAKMAATFASTGTPSFFVHPTECMHGDLGMIKSDDCVIAISLSGQSQELIDILPHLRRIGVSIVGMSAKKNSALASFSDIFIDISVRAEACPLNSAPTSSTTLTMAMGDALAICLMKHKNFKASDFASFHPGGALGKKLFVKALDLARTKNIPTIGLDASLKEAIEVMTMGKIGSVIFTQDNKAVALLSDGDLRRALLDPSFSLSSPAYAYASKEPKSLVAKDLLASDALKIIEEAKIQLLILCGEAQELLGVLHIHDLIEAGIEA